MKSEQKEILPVESSKTEIKENYDKLSKIYDYTFGLFEKRYIDEALDILDIQGGDVVLEVAFGTGYALEKIAKQVGAAGEVCGIDISSGMLAKAEKRLDKADLLDRVELKQGDIMAADYAENRFDCVFMSFALELFPAAEMEELLDKLYTYLVSGGTICLVSLSKEDGRGQMLQIYERWHKKYPKLFDCRPIYLEKILLESEFEIKQKEKLSLLGIPVEIVTALKPI